MSNNENHYNDNEIIKYLCDYANNKDDNNMKLVIERFLKHVRIIDYISAML